MSTISYSTTKGTLGNVTLAFRGKLPKQGVVVCEYAYITFMNYPRADEAIITYPDGKTEVVKSGDTTQALKYEMENITEMILSGKDLSEIENRSEERRVGKECRTEGRTNDEKGKITKKQEGAN